MYKKTKLGRKVLPENERRSHDLRIRVTKKQKDLLQLQADQAGLKLSAYLREKLFK